MLAAASQVEVQAPPGLESMSSLPAESQLQPGDSAAATAASSSEPSRPKTEKQLKEAIVREVTEAVRDHVELKTSAAVDALWQRGQRVVQRMQQEHSNQMEQLHGQLAACAESYRNLEHENALIRTRLEALMKHLTLILGPPPHCMPPMPGGSPVYAGQEFHTPQASPAASPAVAAGSGASSSSTAGAAAAATAAAAAAAASGAKLAAIDETSNVQSSGAEELETPPFPFAPDDCDDSAAAQQGAGAADATASTGTGASTHGADSVAPHASATASAISAAVAQQLSEISELAVAQHTGAPAVPPFTLTLRRADNVPLGLDVRGDTEGVCLVVDAVRPGGAVEAWNRQCAGDSREVRAGDRIIMINSAEDADTMREECLTKHLLRVTVQRGPSASLPAASEPMTGGAPGLTRTTNGGGLRAEADEFVPGGP